jgi:hypothetical protein
LRRLIETTRDFGKFAARWLDPSSSHRNCDLSEFVDGEKATR